MHKRQLCFVPVFLLAAVLLVACGRAPAAPATATATLPAPTDEVAPAGPTATAARAVVATATITAGAPATATAGPIATEPPVPTVPIPTAAAIEARTLTALGDPDAPVTIVEYSDYQCPFCSRHFAETVPDLLQNYVDTGRVYYVFKDFPIANLHPLAHRLHEAALCVGDAGGSDAYWDAHRLFFEDGAQFQVGGEAVMDKAILAALAAAELPDVAHCLAAGTFAAEVEANIAEGRDLGVTSTPSFFINGYPIVGAQPYETFAYAISVAEAGELEATFRRAAEREAIARATATAQAGRTVSSSPGDAPAKGDPDAPVTIVEYSDYQCPFCRRYVEQTLPEIETYIEAGQVRYLFKDFPVLRSHPEAMKAHEAAHCARELGGDDAYWQMHGLLFRNQDAWGGNPAHVEVIKTLAADAGLAQDEFAACLDNDRMAETVTAHVLEGQALGVGGTPTFFINGQRLVGAQPFTVFRQAIEQAGGAAP